MFLNVIASFLKFDSMSKAEAHHKVDQRKALASLLHVGLIIDTQELSISNYHSSH